MSCIFCVIFPNSHPPKCTKTRLKNKIAQKLRIKRPNIVSAGGQPQTPLGSLQRLPRGHSRLGDMINFYQCLHCHFTPRLQCPVTEKMYRKCIRHNALATYSNTKQEAQLLLGDRATRKHAKDCWNGRGNDIPGWNDLQMYFKVIKTGANWKLVYDFLLVAYSNFCRITHRFFWEFDVKQSNDLEVRPRSLTVVSPESCRVAMYVNCSEDSERMKRKSPFSTTALSFDAPSPANPR